MSSYLMDWLEAETKEEKDNIDLKEFSAMKKLHIAKGNPEVARRYEELIKEILK